MRALHAAPASTTSESVDLTLPFATADALVNLLQRNSADLPPALLMLLPTLRAHTDAVLDAMVEDAFGPNGLPLLDLAAA